jgi:hypothetical protein
MAYLRAADRRALESAAQTRVFLTHWLSEHGVEEIVRVSPFVDPYDEPSVLIRITATAAQAITVALGAQAQVNR